MTLPAWLQLIVSEVKGTPVLEWFGVGFGVAEVLLARANRIALYPCGIISVIISTYIFFTAGLYAESLLNVYYLIMSIYGWWLWIRTRGHEPIAVGRANAREWSITAAIAIGGFAILYYALSKWTNSNVPIWDAWVSATAWAGMWLLARRKVENWILLNVSNAFAIPLLIYKHLPLYAMLTAFLFVIAVMGYYKWNRILKEERAKELTVRQ